MSESGTLRRLAAVLAADVAGYSRLMQLDDQATLRALKEARSEFTAAAARHGGRIVNAPGDSILVEFGSVVGALDCAIELQREFATRNAALPEMRRMHFRIGVNLGDVLVDESGIYGDGVNVAARLEGLAEPGGICISGPVHDLVHGRREFSFADLGEQRVKNIARPVRVFRLVAEPHGATMLPHPDPEPAGRPPLSIVVLPFENLSGDPDQGYLADAITEDLTVDLSRIAGSFVISRGSAFTYQGRAVDIRQVGRELGVLYALEGSVRRAGSRVRVNAQLVETAHATQVWADRFDCEFGDVLTLQDEITDGIARALRYELIEAESRRSQREHPHDPQAIDYALRALALHREADKDRARTQRELYREALRRDPTLQLALTGLALTHATEVAFGWADDPAAALAEADELVERASAIAPESAPVLQARGLVKLLRRKPEAALPDLEAAHRRDPNSTSLLLNIAWCRMFLGDPAGAIPHIERALRVDPRGLGRARLLGMLGTARLYLGEIDEAIRCLRQSLDEGLGDFAFVYWMLAAACALAGRAEDARQMLNEFKARRPGAGIAQLRRDALSDHPRYAALREKVYEGLRLAGFEE